MKRGLVLAWLGLLSLLVVPGFGVDVDPWEAGVETFFREVWWPFRPTSATANGFHEYDSRLEDRSVATIQAQIAELTRWRARFEAGHPQANSQQIDRDLLLSAIDSELLELQEVRMWARNPDAYLGLVNQAAFVLVSRSYATPARRLAALAERERDMVKLLAQARVNLQHPPRVYTEVALDQVDGVIAFFERDVPAAFQGQDLAALAAPNQALIQALGEYRDWLRNDLLPRSDGDFRLGPELFARKLWCDERVDIPLEQLRQMAYQDLHRNQQRFTELAGRLAPDKSSREVLEELQREYPAPELLLPTARAIVEDLRGYLDNHAIVTVPSPVLPLVRETPAFMRALTFASMDTPGPYEREATEAYYHLTPPEPDWNSRQVAEHMAGFTRPLLVSTSIHEAYPGHYVQFLWSGRAPSLARRVLGVGTNFEGWAHYCEEMMFEEGYARPADGLETPEYLRLRLGQLQDALLRNARFVVGLQMHTADMRFDEGVACFIKEGYQTPINARMETRRGTSDPTYLMYTLGKLEIYKLRDDYRRQQGPAYSLRAFHDAFLAQGAPPLDLVRRALDLPKSRL